MKTIKLLLCSILTIAALGCSSLNSNQRQDLAIASETAAYIGTVKRLQAHPGDRPRFELASQALAGLAQADDYDPVKFAEVLQPLLRLSGGDADLYVEGVVILFEQARARTPMDSAPLVKTVLGRVQSGIQRGLDRTKPR